jgi:antitoxin (DNA-binding transcriptional repressor) of toxin-antitoxin stability system
MTIEVDINGQDALSELVAHIDAGEDLVLLTRDGETVAIARRPEPKVAQVDRVPGVWAHLGPMDDPDLFLRPDPEFEELAESHDEDEFYRPLTPKE